MKQQLNVISADFGGTGESGAQLIDLLAIAVSLQPGVDAMNLSMIIRTLSEAPAIDASTRVSARRMADMIERSHAAARSE